MGWTFTHREPGMTTEQFFRNEGLGGSGSTILKSAVVGNAFYAAMKNADDAKSEPGRVWAFVALITWTSSYHNFGYKDMDERMGPNEASCPARVLDLLSPLEECDHPETYCINCSSEIFAEGDQWVSRAKDGQTPEVNGPRCYSGYRTSAIPADGGRPFHAPGGTGYCSTCSAREWRASCRVTADRAAAARTVKAGTTVRFTRPIEFRSGAKLTELTFEKGSTFTNGGCRYSVTGWRQMKFEVVSA